ncbi:MAG TPA: 3-hydroxyacyl-CoA dehydrogenase NAD-binding domain-containing protein [Bryobacteraceae bacterium]|nr:3-hydroxyacyl-CoA dehydrogenase NAD-binding domain-containing protein [Bryobacteraceae bacterium]
MPELVRYARYGDVAVITIDNPPVNAMSSAVSEALLARIRTAEADPEVRAAVLIGAGRTFIAGADIREFGRLDGARVAAGLRAALEAVEECSKPVIAAIHGAALGGGLETAMAAHYRLMASTAQVGQPEVKIGLIPGAGGTQRLPRLAGFAKAVDMCAFGAPIGSKDALAAGIVDRVVESMGESDLLEAALAFAREVAGRPIPRTRECSDKLAHPDPVVFSTARDQARRKMRGQPAPLAAIDAVEAASRLPFAEGVRFEAELFERCRVSNQSKSLIHAFFGERAVGKIPDVPPSVPVRTIERVAIVGAGTMGGGIAMVFADAGLPVVIRETTQDALDRGVNTIRANYARSVKSGRITEAAMEQRLERIQGQLTYDGFAEADLVIEAVFENLAVKKRVFADLDRIAKPGCILATNTSSLDVDEIAAATSRPESVVGVHFFSPANLMRLVEIVRGRATGFDVLATAMTLAKKLGKVGVLSANRFGFIGNRILLPYEREAQFLLEEGASVEAVNNALVDFGMAMGPLAVYDQVGLDVALEIEIEARRFEKQPARQLLVLEQLVAMGRLGQKSGAGFAKFDENRKPVPDPEVAALIERCAKEAGIARRIIAKDEIVDRCILAMVNEGARVLEEGVALRAVDIDVVYMTGYGFPPWRGGPMFYADTVGLKRALTRIREFEKRHGSALWAPAPLLERYAVEGRGFNPPDE